MDMTVDKIAFTDSPRARARFINQRTKKKVKEFLVKRRGYKRPDFNRMILDLGRLGWTHEKIADVLPVSGASTVSEWSRGGIPNYDNGDAFILLWQMEVGLDRYPREGEWATYKYKIGQLDMFDDWTDALDGVIEQLDEEIAQPLFTINHDDYKNGDLVMYTDGQPVLLRVTKHHMSNSVMVSKYGSLSLPVKPLVQIRKATEEDIENYKEKQLKSEGRKNKSYSAGN